MVSAAHLTLAVSSEAQAGRAELMLWLLLVASIGGGSLGLLDTT